MKKIKVKASRKELLKQLRLYEFQNFVLYRTLVENIKENISDSEDKERTAIEKAKELIKKVENSILVVRNDGEKNRKNGISESAQNTGREIKTEINDTINREE